MKRWTVFFPAAAAIAALLLPSLAAGATKDPFSNQQWGFHRTGAEFAWKVSRGAGVLIGVIDSGVDLQHPDLKDKVTPGKDYIDPGTDADDANGHGTLIAGIAAASTDNGIGIASVAPDAQILPVRVFNVTGTAYSDEVADAIRWATDEAKNRNMKLALNLSFVEPPGDEGADLASLIFADPDVKDAILYAADKGAAVVAAAGNDSRASTAYDAPSDRGIIVVGSSDRQDRCATFTNYGDGLDILAPGVDIISTYWDRDNDNGESVYASADGTSVSVPFVAGAAAVLISSGMTNVAAVQRLIATASGPGISCKSESTRYKILDLAAAAGVTRPPSPPPPAPSPTAPRASPSPAQSPVALVLPSPGEPPVLVVETPSPGPSPLETTEVAEKKPSGIKRPDPLKTTATLLALASLLLHGFRKKLI